MTMSRLRFTLVLHGIFHSQKFTSAKFSSWGACLCWDHKDWKYLLRFSMIFWYGPLFFCPPSFWTMEMILAFLTNCWGYLHFGYLDLGFPTFQDFMAFASEVINFIVAFAETYGEIEAMCGKKPQKKKKKHPMPSKMISITITAHYFRKRKTAFTPQLQFWQKLPPRLASFSAEQRILGQRPALIVCRRR